MGLLDKLFGKRRTPSSGSRGEIKIDDLRTADEREKEEKLERRARRSLGGEDEQIARKLLSLIRQADSEYDVDQEAFKKTETEIKEIGKYLCSNGGSDRTLKIAYRVQALGASVRDLERYWGEDYICGWMD